jgi:hypothetical protein
LKRKVWVFLFYCCKKKPSKFELLKFAHRLYLFYSKQVNTEYTDKTESFNRLIYGTEFYRALAKL